MAKLDTILVYHWQAWDGFLISHLVAGHCHCLAKYDDDISAFTHALTPDIRAVLFQINLSHAARFPAQRQQLIAQLRTRNILLLNTEVEDISKRHLHHLLEQAGLRSAKATRSGPAQQVLFIKSNLNWGGEVEQRLPAELKTRFVAPGLPLIQRWDNYYTIQRADMIDPFWQDESIVIENYITNEANSFFRIYGFGDAIVVVEAFSQALIKKISGHADDTYQLFTRQEIFDKKTPLPIDLQDVLRTFMLAYPLFYFCLDIVHGSGHSGHSVHDQHQFTIIDLNLTPYAGTQPQTAEAVEFLCAGAQAFLERHLPARVSSL